MATVFWYTLMVLEVLCSILLIGIILLQRTKGQGIGMAFGAGLGESLFGARVGNVLTRTTVVLAVIFLINTTILVHLGAGRRRPRSVVDKADPLPAGPATTAPFASQMPQETPAPGPVGPIAAQPPVVQGEPQGVVMPPVENAGTENLMTVEPVQPVEAVQPAQDVKPESPPAAE